MDPFVWGLTQRAVELCAAGLNEWSLRGPEWLTPFWGLRRPAGLALSETDARIVDAIALMTPGCVLGGWASLYVQGVTWCDGIDRYGQRIDVPLITGVGAQLRKRPGIRPCERRLHRDEVVDFYGIRVTTLARSAYDAMLDARGIHEAVVVAEMATSSITDGARTTLDNLRHVVLAHKKTRGIVHVRAALERAGERSASPWETRLRLVAEDDAHIMGCLVNWPVFDLNGYLLGIADLIEPTVGLILESDGADHREQVRHSEDNVREEKFERSGLVVARAGAIDHRKSNSSELKQRLMSARSDAASNRIKRRWTLEQPSWWDTWEPGRRYRSR